MESRIPHDLASRNFDLIVVGAGINGAGIARDAAMRGLRVLLLDKGDISSGTTQWATRLIHGGLRYLEHYEFALVRESLRDREAILHVAPHLVKPLGFLVPIYERSKRGPLLVRLGMTLYDLAERPDGPEHILIEASGVADPARIAGYAGCHPRLCLDGIVVLADAETVRARARDRFVGDVVRRQLAAADLVVLSRTDLVDARATREARAITPDRPLQSTTQGARTMCRPPGSDSSTAWSSPSIC